MKSLPIGVALLRVLHDGLIVILIAGAIGTARGQTMTTTPIDIEAEPFVYSETKPNNRVSRLVDRIESGETRLKRDGETGYLKSLLDELDIPVSSQVLVFSKTSLQVRFISRRNPRAIYFNDDTYVGWVRGSSIMEISTFDPNLGAAFYTVNAEPSRALSSGVTARLPLIEQATYDCLSCHATTMSQGVPGHVVRSVVPEFDGSIASQKGSFVTDHTSPLSERWGGWYVTGRHGEMTHMGNTFLRGGRLDTSSSGNRLSLRDEFDTFDYLSPYSDIVALMVLEHQTQMHNTFTRATFTTRQLHHELRSNPSEESIAELNLQVKRLAEEIVDGLLFHDETLLDGPIQGSVLFASDFVRRGKSDEQGRSLREFDLNNRMFKYPCSYLIDSEPCDALPSDLRKAVGRRLLAVLEGDEDTRNPNLNAENRKIILEMIRSSKPDLF